MRSHVLTIITMLVLITAPTMAADPDHRPLCLNEGQLASKIAEARDAGVSMQIIDQKVDGVAIQNNMSPEQQLAIRHLVRAIYSDPDITPVIAATAALKTCLGQK
jgi:hypothetical protein